MSEPQRKRALVLRSFNDAGTGESFEAEKTVMIDAGAFANYEAAGLVSAPSAAEGEEASPGANKSRAKAE